MKRDTNEYFEGFVSGMTFACKAADFLVATTTEFSPYKLEMQLMDVHEIEHDADYAKHALIEKLVREFITPIEREDIMTLLQQIDDVTDGIEEVARCMYMYNVQSIRNEMREFADVIRQCCIVSREALAEMPRFRKSETIKDAIIRVNDLEEQGDRIYCAAMRRLFAEENDSVERLVWTRMFDTLENCCDACEHVMDSVEAIMMKNS